jgi:hypothetical protein
MLRNVVPEVYDSDDALVATASVAQARINYDAATEELICSFKGSFRNCQALYTHVESIFGEVYSSYVARDICDEEVAYKLRVLRGNCRVCYTNADREFHKAVAQIQISAEADVHRADAHRAAVELSEQCQKLMQLMTELDRDAAGWPREDAI